ncbi:MAG: hypothetical protein V4659_10375 [Pseudomonadota bacterium]
MWLLMLLAGAPDAATLMVHHLERTAATIRCVPDTAGAEVVVCGRRQADRYRLPLASASEPGDPRHEGVHDERERLQAKRDNCAEKSAFLIGCGKVGLGLVTNASGTRRMTAREIAD